MKAWQTHRLGDLVDEGGGSIQTGPFGSQLHASDYVAEGIPCIMPADMKNNRVDVSEIARISEHDANRLKRHIVQTGDIVYSRRGDVTQKALITERENGFFCGTGCLLLRPGAKIDPAFLTYYLSTKTYQSWIASQAVGATMPNLNTGILSRVSFRAPEKPDQQRIASALSTLDAKIELNQRMNEELEGMAKLLYDYWFVQFDFPMSTAQAAALGKRHLTGHPYRASGGPMTYHETLKREIPKGWALTTIGAFSDNFDSKRIPLSKAEREKRPGTIPYYGATEVMDHIDDFIFDGDYVLVAEDGSVMDDAGFPVTQFIYGKTWVNNHTHVLRAKNPDNNEFLLHSIKRIPVINIMTGSIQKKITQDNLNAVPLANPTSDCLEAFSKIANTLRKQRTNLEQQTQELTTLRDWLLPMLMNGQVTVGC